MTQIKGSFNAMPLDKGISCLM